MRQAVTMNNNEASCQQHSSTTPVVSGGNARIEAFLDNNGYTAREVRSIVRWAIAQWEQQRK